MTKHHFFRSGPLFGIIAVALIWVASVATPANALVAAGTQISNQATVSFAEGADVTSLAVLTTVNLVAASPTLTFVDFASTPGSTAAISSPESTGVDVNYRLVGNSNGPDTYEFVPAPSSADVDVTVAPTLPAIGNILLGAVITDIGAAVPVNTTTVLNVMSDSNTGDGVVHDIAVGDFVFYNNGVADVTGIDETTNLYTVITLGTALPTAPGQGEIVSEAVDFTYTVTTGTMTDPLTASSHAVTVNVRSTTDIAQTAVQNPDPATINLVRATLTIVKYVRNITNAANNPGVAADITYATNDYWVANVTGDSTVDTLEYLIVVSNVGSSPATDVQVADAISTYLTFAAGSVDIDTDGVGGFDVIDAEANDAATFVSPDLTVFAGVGGSAGGGTGGAIAAGATSAVRFQAAIQ